MNDQTAPRLVIKIGQYVASLPHPARQSVTARLTLVAASRKRLAHAGKALSSKPDAQVILDLLWSRAMISQALAAQTRGQMGDANATCLTEARLLGLSA